MTSLFRNTLAFVIGYVILMIPTYVLPWLGSNSAVMNVVGAAIGHGMTPQWWAHAWCLVMLILLTWARGDFIGKKYLPVFPFLAAVFDLTPGLSMIPLIPTVLHLVAIILGVKVGVQQPVFEGVANPVSRRAGMFAGLMTAAAVLGSVLFVSTSQKTLTEFSQQGVAAKNSPEKSAFSSSEPMPPETAAASPASPTVSGSQSGSSTRQIQKRESSGSQHATKEPAKVRYINLNE